MKPGPLRMFALSAQHFYTHHYASYSDPFMVLCVVVVLDEDARIVDGTHTSNSPRLSKSFSEVSYQPSAVP